MSLLSSNFAIAFSITITASVLFMLVVFCVLLWWVDVKRGTIKGLFKAIGKKIYNAFDAVYDFFNNERVKTVYSKKSKNYSEIEFLAIPSKKPTSKYTYEFLGWEKCGYDKERNLLVKPIYLKKVIKCTVRVYDEDKTTLLASYEVDFGAGIDVSGLNPKKPDSKEFSYEFAGFDKDVSAFYKNESVYVVYRAIPKLFSYTFYDYDGKTVVSSGRAIYGSPLVAPATPVRQNYDGLVYNFSRWKGFTEGYVLTKDCSFVAVYETSKEAQVFGNSLIDDNGKQVSLKSAQSQGHK